MYDVDAIRAAHPITETVRDAGVELRQSGRRLAGRCPFHRDRQPSLVVYPATRSWFCYGCGAGGDVIDFVARFRGTGFRETAEFLGGSALAAPVPAKVVRLSRPPVMRAVAAEEVAVVEAAIEHYERATDARRVRRYLGERGVDAATAQAFRIGYAAGGLARYLHERGIDVRVAEQLGLVSRGRESFAGRVVIPDLDGEGRARWLTGRALDDREPRYLNLRAPVPLLGLARARSLGARAVVVTEGPFDWLAACGWGMHAVALLGTHASRDALAALRAFRRVYLALDADGAGHRAAARIAAELGPRAVVVPLPAGAHDLGELGRRRDGREAFLRSLHQARTRMEDSWPRAMTRDQGARAA